MVFIAELEVVRIWILAEVDFVGREEVFYFMAEVYVLEMCRLSLRHAA